MKMIKTRVTEAFLVIFFGLLSLLAGCKKNEDTSGLTIKAGFACGWGAGEDSLEISRSGIKYVYYVPSKSSSALIRTSRTIPASEWNEITEIVNMDSFARLKYNTCNICVDGCDEWIYINNGRISHSIRFTKGEEIAAIEELQKKLAELRAEFN
jgi:hypothetical protein